MGHVSRARVEQEVSVAGRLLLLLVLNTSLYRVEQNLI